MARPRQHSDATLLEAARVVFLRDGAAASTAEVAKSAGCSQAALFKRFGSKEDLMVAALRPPERPEWVEAMARGPDERPIAEQLTEHARAASRFFGQLIPCLAVLHQAGVRLDKSSHEVPPPVRAALTVSAWFARAIEAGRVRKGDPTAMAALFLGPLQTRAFMSHMLGRPIFRVDDGMTDELISTLWRGLAPPEEDTP